MKAIVINAYGSPDVFELKEVDKPEVLENDVLVRVLAAGINAGDYFSMRGSPWLARFSVGFPKPNNYILGWDVAGQVEAIGEKVTRVQAGDDVFGLCSHTFAEYVSADADKLVLKPANTTFEQAAVVPSSAITALQGLRDAGNVQPGQKVLINGASGGVGTFAVQIAKSFGVEVSGVCSTRNVEMVRSIGADYVFDYTREDFTKSGQRYDLILDNVANRSFSDLKRVLTPEGLIIPNSGHGGMGYVFKAFLLSPFMSQLRSPLTVSETNEDLVFLSQLLETGKLTPVIDKTYPLSETSEALRYLEEEHARGKVVITM